MVVVCFDRISFVFEFREKTAGKGRTERERKKERERKRETVRGSR